MSVSVSDKRGSANAAPAPEIRLTRAEASAVLAELGIRMKPATLARIFSTGGDGPPCRHIRGKPFYPRDVLEAWAQTQITDLRTSAPPKKAWRHGR
jgi:hypothetical protein